MGMDDKRIKLENRLEYGSKEAVIQNLEDAGCASDIIESCMTCMEQGKKKELLKQLDEHRADLLNKIHKTKSLPENEFCPEQTQIDCLDYLVYQIGRCKHE